MRGYLRHRLGDAQDADEVLQDVFLKALRDGRRFCTVENARAWLYQVTRNALVDWLRSSREHIPLPEDMPAPADATAPQVDGLSQCLPRVLAELSEADRLALTLCDIKGHPPLELGGETLEVAYTDAQFPGDARVWLPKRRVVFSGDLVYPDRLLGVLSASSVRNGQTAFQSLEALQPKRVVPDHGGVCDAAQTKREAGDYYDVLAEKVGTAAKAMELMDATLDRYADLPQFRHLDNYGSLHRATMTRTSLELEEAP